MTSPSTPPNTTHPGSDDETFPTTWRRVMTEPRAFFAEMPEAGGLQAPLTFLLLCAALYGAGMMLWNMSVSAGLSAALGMAFYSGVLAVAVTLIAQQLFDGPAGFEPTFRAVAYAAAPLVLQWIPGVGVLAQVYGWYVAVRGLERVHGFDTPRALLTVAAGVLILGYVGFGYGKPARGCHEPKPAPPPAVADTLGDAAAID